MMAGTCRAAWLGVWMAASAAGTSLEASDPLREPGLGAETRTVVAGERYRAGPLHELVFGRHYRDLWVTPIRVPVLDLTSFDGGLRPVKKGGGKQTRSLTLESGAGRKWKVRSVDKDPTKALPPDLRHTLVDNLAQDQMSAEHPAGPIVVDALAAAAGLPHVTRRMVVLPDDPKLGEFREEFAGMLGYLEEDPRTKPPVTRGLEAYSELESTEELWDRMDRDPAEHVDARAFLKVRLFDVLIGDYDRHEDQWDWARRRDRAVWVPVAKDRDLAFAKFDGAALKLVRQHQPRLVDFEEDYGNVVGLVWQGRYMDRRHLTGLEWPLWAEVTAELQSEITDEAIDQAVARMPPEYYPLSARRMAERLKSRRRLLPKAARQFYLAHAREAEVQASDRNDVAEILRSPDGSLEVHLAAPPSTVPYFRRRFLPGETEEVRVFLKGGDDRAVCAGGSGPILVRVIGGDGSDVLDDSACGHARFYDTSGENRVVAGPGTEQSDRIYVHPTDRDGNPDRDWGAQTTIVPWAASGGQQGVVLGGQVELTRYGFRKHPFASRHSLRAGYATGARAGRVEYEYETRKTGSRKWGDVLLSASELSLLHFHGFGNETSHDAPDELFDVSQRQYALGSSFFRLGLDQVDLWLGLRLQYSTTRLPPDRFIGQVRPYGAEAFGQAGPAFRLVLDRREGGGRAPTGGSLVSAGGAYYPPVWSVKSAFGEVHGESATYLKTPLPLQPILALRVGGRQVWGRYPFQEAAFLGGPESVRGLRRQRYAGDAAVFGNAELRVRLARLGLVAPTDVGVFALADVGRVFLSGETSRRWHPAVGGGIWLAPVKPENAISLAVAESEGRLRVYLQAGFMF